jgi:hypothetical protein
MDKPLIIFGKEILERGFIKACFKLGMRNRISRYRKIQDDEYENNNKFKSQVFEQARPKASDAIFSYQEIHD